MISVDVTQAKLAADSVGAPELIDASVGTVAIRRLNIFGVTELYIIILQDSRWYFLLTTRDR